MSKCKKGYKYDEKKDRCEKVKREGNSTRNSNYSYHIGTSETTGIGFTGLLTILFIGLKLTGYINWSWWWVLSPLWIGFAIGIIIFLVFVFIIRIFE